MRTLRSFLAAAFFVVVASSSACLVDTDSGRGGLNTEQNAEDCTLTQGFWKNHAEDWPVLSLQLGARVYTQAELLAIFGTPTAGNGLISLSHQLIAAKLNVAAGADVSINVTIAAADALIGSLVTPPVGGGYLHPSVTSALNDALDAFNNSTGNNCAGAPVCGDGNVDAGETCDDGNTANGDGCSATCTPEAPAPTCGDGTVNPGELCDDGNTANGDGCSATCTPEAPAPTCGDGTVNPGELCDDGNTANGDGCSATCTPEVPAPECGNGVVEPGEQCDDGNGNDQDGCSNTCTEGT